MKNEKIVFGLLYGAMAMSVILYLLKILPFKGLFIILFILTYTITVTALTMKKLIKKEYK